LTVASHLQDEELCDVEFVGTPDGLEARLAAEAGLVFHGVPARGFDRSRPLSLIGAAFTAVASWMRCMRILRRYRPDVVICFGGYASLPLGMATATAGLPLVLHEQNAVPGLTNRVLSRWARTVCVTYQASISRLARPTRAFVTGNPVRPAVAASSRDAGRAALRLKPDDLVLLVFGGSRGARHLNTAIVGLYDRLKSVKGLRVVHVAGREEIDAVKETLAAHGWKGGRTPFWRVFDYIDAMGDALAAADLVVCRAGATTIAELTALGKAALLVPYPYATEDHQTLNAQALVVAGAAVMVSDSAIDESMFGDEIVRLLTHARARAEMEQASASLARPTAAHAVGDGRSATRARSYRDSARRSALHRHRRCRHERSRPGPARPG
jgi:UDP-N-acetylglucosamine--N-acetylmuramyl-(pentapeptide) pyrophosphoryl-undecaprenol N-acetylglucosamine transferase